MENNDKTIDSSLVPMIQVGTMDVLNLDITNNLEQSLLVLTSLVKSKKLGSIVTPETALAYYIKSKELGVPFLNAIDHMFDVSGKTSLDVHLMRALLLKAGNIHWEEIYNNAPLYKYIDSNGETIVTGYDDSCLPEGYIKVIGNNNDELKADFNRIESIGYVAVFKKAELLPLYINAAGGTVSIFNYGTKYKFTRLMRFSDGTTKTLIEYGEFSLKEALIAGLHLKKDGSVNMDSPWICYHRNMNEARSWTFGARKIGDDILLGALEHTELLDLKKSKYTLVNDAVVTDAEVIESK